jgi:hypothetical protein
MCCLPRRFPVYITVAPITKNQANVDSAKNSNGSQACQFLAPVVVIASLAGFGGILDLSIIHTELGVIHDFQAGCVTIVIATG